jgi:hypothetical protein
MKKYSILYLSLLGLLLLALAFIFYPGSAYYDVTATHYRFFANTISDSGITQTYRHELNMWSQLFFTLGIFSLATVQGLFLWQQSKWKLNKICAGITGILYFLIPFIPSDLHSDIHEYIFFAATLSLLISFLLLGLATSKNIFRALSGVLLIYIIFILAYPDTTASEAIHTAHVVAQKAVLLLVLLGVLGYDTYVKRTA